MKKILLLTFVLLTLTACGGEKKSAPTPTTSTGVNLENCKVYFDGCNNCQVQNGQITACTEMACSPEAMSQPVCRESVVIDAPIAVESIVLNSDRSNYWYKTQCHELGGLFFVDNATATKKCVGITPAQCPALGGGYYNNCASPCVYLADASPACVEKCIGLCYITRDVTDEPPRELYGDTDKITFEGFVPNEVTSFPVFLRGTVSPDWPLKGSFGVKILTERKKVLASQSLIANTVDVTTGARISDQMLDFYGEIYADPPANQMRGFIRFESNNPSDVPGASEWVDVPIRFQ